MLYQSIEHDQVKLMFSFDKSNHSGHEICHLPARRDRKYIYAEWEKISTISQ